MLAYWYKWSRPTVTPVWGPGTHRRHYARQAAQDGGYAVPRPNRVLQQMTRRCAPRMEAAYTQPSVCVGGKTRGHMGIVDVYLRITHASPYAVVVG